MTQSQTRPAYQTLWFLCAAYFLIMLLLGLDRHWSLKTSIYDTGVFDQAIWSCLNGNILLNTINLSEPINWLGFHFHPILFLFVPLYKLSPSPEWLIIGQSLAVAIAAIPIYKIAIKLNYTGWQGLCWAISYLLNPFVLSAAIWDFHPVALAAPVVGFSLYYLIANEFEKLIGCIVILLLCQEQFGLLVITLGVSYFLLNKDVKKSLVIVLVGAAYTVIVFMYVFPALSPTGSHIMMTSQGKSLNRYNWLGNSLPAIIMTILQNPWSILKFSLIDMAGYKYILFLLIPYGTLLPVFGIELLIIGAADFIANFLSLNPLPRLIIGYHSITIIPAIIASAMTALDKIKKTATSTQVTRLVFLTAASFLTLFSICIPHILGEKSPWSLDPFPSKNAELAEIQKLIPAGASVSAQANLGSHFSQRKRIYAYPNKISEADFIILKPQDSDEPLKHDDFRFMHNMMMEPEKYLASIKCLLEDKKLTLYYFRSPWLVFSKQRGESSKINAKSVYRFLDTLANQWHLDKAGPILNECRQIT